MSTVKMLNNPVLNDLMLLAIEEGLKIADEKLEGYVQDLKQDRKSKGDREWQRKTQRSSVKKPR